MRGSNDCLCIFGLDFQLYIADIIVLDAVRCGIKLNFSIKNGLSVLLNMQRKYCFQARFYYGRASNRLIQIRNLCDHCWYICIIYKVPLWLLRLTSIRYWMHCKILIKKTLCKNKDECIFHCWDTHGDRTNERGEIVLSTPLRMLNSEVLVPFQFSKLWRSQWLDVGCLTERVFCSTEHTVA